MGSNNTKKSIGISFATQYAELAIQFLSVLALARILTPDDIGIYSVAAFLMTMLHVFRDFGVVQYIIQERDLSTEKIRAAMGVAIILALAVALVLVACSGFLARFYGKPEIQPILYVMALSFAVSPFGSLLIGILRREFKLKTIFYIKVTSSLCHVAVALLLALDGHGAISLAWANFAGILSFGIVANMARPKGIPWRPSFRNIRTILSFGSISSLGNAARIAGTSMPDLVIGKIISMAAVGYFSRASGLVQLFTRLITGALTPLVLPYFAEMRRSGRSPVEPYLSAVGLLTALAWPFFAALALMAQPMIRALYGDQWDASVPIAQLLCAAGAITSISLFSGQVMVANGGVRNATWCELLALPFRIGGLFLAAPGGLQMIAASLVVTELIYLLIVTWFLNRAIQIRPFQIARACGKSLLVALGAVAGPLAVVLAWGDMRLHPWPPLLSGIASAAIGWSLALWLTRHPLLNELLSALAPRFAVSAAQGKELS